MTFPIPDLDYIELSGLRRRDFNDAYISVATNTLMLTVLLFGVVSRQWLHIHWLDMIVGFFAWAYVILIGVVALLAVAALFLVPIFAPTRDIKHLRPRERIASRIAPGRFSPISLFNALFYPSIFYFSGHHIIGFILGGVALGLVSLLYVISKLSRIFATDHYDNE